METRPQTRERKDLQTARPMVGPESQRKELGSPQQKQGSSKKRGRGDKVT